MKNKRELTRGTRHRLAPSSGRSTPSTRSAQAPGVERAKRKFLKFFPLGFYDPKYISWERGYKWTAHELWEETLSKSEFRKLLKDREFEEIALRAVRIESKTNLLFSFEKMALRDAVKSHAGAEAFARGLYDLLHGPGSPEKKFGKWIEVIASLPRKQTRVLTWPLATVFGFIAQPQIHFFLKPNVTRKAAKLYGYDLDYASRPSTELYAKLLAFATTVRRDLKDLKPRDFIDIQSFLWVQGSDEYD